MTSLEKYKDLIGEKNFYTLLLNAKTDIRKLLRKGNVEEALKLFVDIISVLVEHKEAESALTLISSFLDEYEKTYSKEHSETFLTYLYKAFSTLPSKDCNKSALKLRILKFFESKGIQDISIQRIGFYVLFAKDSIYNKDIIEGYRYALKSQDYEIIDFFIQCYSEECKSDSEKFYFIARLCLELILLNNLDLAFKFINKYIDSSNNYQNNHIILNFVFLLLVILTKNSGFEAFYKLVDMYKDRFQDKTFIKYLNKISQNYFNRQIANSGGSQNFNILNLLNSLSN
jgi:hypothetical protein